MRRVFQYLALCGIILATALPIAAQEAQPGAKIESRDEAMQRLEMVRLYRLVELLELDQDQAAQLFPIFRKYDQQFRQIGETLELTTIAIRTELQKPQPDATLLRQYTDDYVALEQQAFDVRSEQYKELKTNLTEEQTAKYLLFEKQFQDEMNRLLYDVRQKKLKLKKPKAKTATPEGEQ